jgi:hypothetical protein
MKFEPAQLLWAQTKAPAQQAAPMDQQREWRRHVQAFFYQRLAVTPAL